MSGGHEETGYTSSKQTAERSFSVAHELARACGAELMSTTLFVLIGVTAVINNQGSVVGVALAHGLMIFLLVAMTANVSGGHVNPAVSFGVWLAGDISLVRFTLYFVSQLVGASIGGALALGLNGVSLMESIDFGTHHPPGAHSKGQALGIEIFTTFVLVTTVLANAVDKKGFKNIAPLCIGLAVTAGILASGDITGGSMNPARSFGPCVASLRALQGSVYTSSTYYEKFWKDQWIYFVGPLLGGAVAAVNFRFVLSSHPLKRVHVM